MTGFMKLSDKALRQIGRKLLARPDESPLRAYPATREKHVPQLRAAQPWRLGRKQRKAAVLTFRKRQR